MDSTVRVPGRIGPRTLLITAAAVPLAGWAVHAVALHKRLAATRRDPLTGLLRRGAYTARARRLLARHGDDLAVVMVDADHFKAVNDTLGHAAGDVVLGSDSPIMAPQRYWLHVFVTSPSCAAPLRQLSLSARCARRDLGQRGVREAAAL
ncbi:diguanylate cyclase [Streptomyces sp. gb14]|uniref:diguanylate cyclase n=1 Tax=Streptomyces sp. gb14 TaxID=1827753 RepID=UPI00118154E5|nr:diguanylate cyclase [Streptomyces sp. gb14]